MHAAYKRAHSENCLKSFFFIYTHILKNIILSLRYEWNCFLKYYYHYLVIYSFFLFKQEFVTTRRRNSKYRDRKCVQNFGIPKRSSGNPKNSPEIKKLFY